MKKLVVGLIVSGLLVGGAVMAMAQQHKASPKQTQQWIKDNASSQYVPPVPKPTPVVVTSTSTAKGSTTTAKTSKGKKKN